MAEIRLDPYFERYATRTRGMTASEIRALFEVASRPEIAFLAGGMPYTAALDHDAVASLTHEILVEKGTTALQYGGGQGLPALREQLVEVMAAEGASVHADDLLVTVGGQQALDLVAKLFCDPGDLIIAEGPSYVGALGAFSSYQAHVLHMPMDGDGIIPEALAESLQWLAREGRIPKFLYTIPNHQNPAGVSLSVQRREQLVELAQRFDLLIVEDNPYGLLDFKAEVRPTLKSIDPDRVIYIGTLSKIFSPGIRVGWVAAPAAARERLVLLKEAADLCQSNLTQHVAQRWFATQPWLEQVEAYREIYRERCEAMLTELAAELPASCSWSSPTGGFFVWVRLPDGLDAKGLLAKALSARVAYVPGQAFYADGAGANEMRLSFCYPPVDQIRDGVRRLGKVISAEIELVKAIYGGRE
ncbi:MAG TPA: PLP-dependent aminotransferase family protein [Egibacteraceae bacterium]|nr:PLP-dependent aminotransferase family protein [Egibacteraceae bacterium]